VMFSLIAPLIRWITGDLSSKLLAAYQSRLNAESDEAKLVAEVAIEDIKQQMAARQNAKEIRLATAGFWEMRLIVALIAGSFTLHLVLVTLDTCFKLGWAIPKFPAPFDEYQGLVLLSFFGVYATSNAIGQIANAIRRR
jgi:hypothetical protein